MYSPNPILNGLSIEFELKKPFAVLADTVGASQAFVGQNS